MKHFLAVIIAAFTFLVMGQVSAATIQLDGTSIDSLTASFVCAEEKDKKKKKGDDDEEPECD